MRASNLGRPFTVTPHRPGFEFHLNYPGCGSHGGSAAKVALTLQTAPSAPPVPYLGDIRPTPEHGLTPARYSGEDQELPQIAFENSTAGPSPWPGRHERTHRPVGLMDKASASGAGDSRLESWAGHLPFARDYEPMGRCPVAKKQCR